MNSMKVLFLKAHAFYNSIYDLGLKWLAELLSCFRKVSKTFEQPEQGYSLDDIVF